ncbi:hypothetical protein [Peterkaempfera griseoplana]|uniref:hypothetical protein n=1 Tax=Peterkaempfera griseoplana TaxID=66896 RepID=UPI0006E1314C|nr:hypothetical protein [Peterkaempfera griseoplana]
MVSEDTLRLAPVPDAAVDPGPAEHRQRTRPVFVDASGRRRRLVRRLGVLLAVMGAGYVALLVSTVLGGPTVRTPLLPASQPAHHRAPVGAVPSAHPAAGTHRPAAGDGASRTPVSALRPAVRPHAPATAATPSAGATTRAAGTAPAAVPTAPAAIATAKGRGNSTAAPGASHRPTSHP